MVGLRTQEGHKFEKFFALVQEEARSQGSAFFLDCGEGREFETELLCGEDLSGWLIPLAQADKFDSQFKSGVISEAWLEFVRFAQWSKTGDQVRISFHKY